MSYHLVMTKSAKIECRPGVLCESQRIHTPQNLALGPHEHIRGNSYERVCDSSMAGHQDQCRRSTYGRSRRSVRTAAR